MCVRTHNQPARRSPPPGLFCLHQGHRLKPTPPCAATLAELNGTDSLPTGETLLAFDDGREERLPAGSDRRERVGYEPLCVVRGIDIDAVLGRRPVASPPAAG